MYPSVEINNPEKLRSAKKRQDNGALRCPEPVKLPINPCQSRKWNLEYERKKRQVDPAFSFECENQDKRSRMEAKRNRIIRKLKYEYKVNVEDVNPVNLKYMISKVEAIEKEKKMREREKIECRINLVKKLVQEEKYKRRSIKPRLVTRKKSRKSGKKMPASILEHEEIVGEDEAGEGDSDALYDHSSCNIDYEESNTKVEEAPELSEFGLEGEQEEGSESDADNVCSKLRGEFVYGSEFLKSLRETNKKDRRVDTIKPKEGSNETQLECYPDSIIFQNIQPNKSYIKTYRIVNVGQELIHCHYIGIEVKDLSEGTEIPFWVEVNNNALLRPGLSYTSKIRLFYSSKVADLEGFLLYETRRKKNPQNHAYFRVPVACTTARSKVEVTPTTVRFPTVTWHTATGPQRPAYLSKVIRIQNKGRRDCTCIISKKSREDLKTNGDGQLERVEECTEDGYKEDVVEYPLCSIPNEQECLEEDNEQSGYSQATAIVSELIENTFEVFRFSPKYFINLPAMSTVNVTVEFFPEYKGYHYETVYIQFDGAFNTNEVKLDLIGDIKKVPVRLEPSSIDLHICTINSGVYEGVFNVHNDSNGTLPIKLKVPSSMKNHALVFPKAPLLQPKSYQTCSVRLFPRVTIARDASRYYKEDTKVLEFPIFIEPSGPGPCKYDRIKLCVFAILTDYSLELCPREIDFGVVNTLETIRVGIKLTNHSLAPQEYGFVNLREGVRVEPGFGFGVILPKETIPLDVLYSPADWRTGQNMAQEGPLEFSISVTSISEVGGCGERLEESISISRCDSSYVDGIRNEECIYNSEKERVTPEEEYQDQENLADAINDEEDDMYGEDDDSYLNPAEEFKILEDKENKIREYLNSWVDKRDQTVIKIEEESSEIETNEEENTIKEEDTYSIPIHDTLNTIICKAHVIIPYCQLSATVIQLPATPVSSYSFSKFRLIATNPKPLKCGISTQNAPLEAVFQFQSSSPLVTIEPRTGRIQNGQSIPIAVIFRPEIPKRELQYHSKVFKAETEFEGEMKEREYSVSPKLCKSKSKTAQIGDYHTSRRSKLEVELQSVNMTNMVISQYDLFVGERILQQMIDPFHFVIKIECRVRTVTDFDRRESHRLVVVAPVVKPSFIYLGNSQEIQFGKVIVGDKVRKIIEIQNISLERIALSVTALNPRGPFTCTTGWKMDRVDPEHIWRQPITFAPFEERGKEVELFEIRHGMTAITLIAKGEGIEPKYSFSPDFAVCIMESVMDSSSEAEFYVDNLCEAEIRIKLDNIFTKMAYNQSRDSVLSEDNRKEGLDTATKTEKERRISTMAKDTRRHSIFASEMNLELARKLDEEYEFFDNSLLNVFSVTGLDPNNEAVIHPNKRILLKLKFSPKNEIAESKGENATCKIRGYAAKYNIMIGYKCIKEITAFGIITPLK